jgi:hypothetical protein
VDGINTLHWLRKWRKRMCSEDRGHSHESRALPSEPGFIAGKEERGSGGRTYIEHQLNFFNSALASDWHGWVFLLGFLLSQKPLLPLSN